MPKRKYRKYTKKEKARYYAAKRVRRSLYNVNTPEAANLRWNIVGPNRYQRAAGKGTATADQMAMRKAIGYYGEGDYRKWLKYGSRAIGAGLGAATGYATGGWGGAYGGAKSGWGAGAKFSKTMGWGDYTTPMISNQIVAGSPGASSDTPVMLNHMGDLSGDIILQHREFIQNVTVADLGLAKSSSLEKSEFELNPGIKATFPFLSQIANNFELYEFEGLAFQFVPHYGEGEDSILGKVIMVTNYDPDSRSFKSSQEMQNYDYACTAKPSIGQLHGVETASHKRATDLLYVRDKTVTRDKVFTDIGKFTIATEGVPRAGNIGELWVTYKVRLSRAHLNDHFGTEIDHAITKVNESGVVQSEDSTKRIKSLAFPTSSQLLVSFEDMHSDSRYKLNVSICRETSGGNQTYASSLAHVKCAVDPYVFCHSASSFMSTSSSTDSQTVTYFKTDTLGSDGTCSVQINVANPIYQATKGDVRIIVTLTHIPEDSEVEVV
jgi:hypothetical protein